MVMRSGTLERAVPVPTLAGGLRGREVCHDSLPQGCLVTEVETRYIDVDGDGLLDAVEIAEHVIVVQSGSRRIMSTTRTVAAQIGDDGIPHRMRVWTTP
jgi:hypothetical protein